MSDKPVEKLKNIGPQSAGWLRDVGIETEGDLIEAGAVMAYKILQHRFKGVNLLMLYALEGALQNRHYNSFSPEEKEVLKKAASESLDISFD